MRKNTKIYLLMMVLTLVASSCNDQLNIDPAQSIDVNNALSTSGDVKATLVGAYSELGSGDLYGGGIYVYADLLGNNGDMGFYGTFQGLTQINNKDIPINNGFISDVWTKSYKVINTTNAVIDALEVVDEADRAQVEGEAKFIRGSLYFELIKLYAKAWNDGDPITNPGVPLILTPTNNKEDATKHPSRNSVKEVYIQILSDLTEAEQLLPTPDNASYFYATTAAAAAMLSRVYLMQGNYPSSRDAADRVISSGIYKLIDKYGDEFPYPGRGARIYTTSEDIFAQQVSEQSGVNDCNAYYAASDLGGRGEIEMTDQHFALYELNDDRYNLFYDDGGSIRTGKFSNQYGNIKILRLAEMYLTRAEANFRLGESVGASPLDDINIIRARAKLDPLLSIADVETILNERYLELAFEGQWLPDYKRTERPVGALDWNSPSLVFPIPQREMIVNKNLVQNEGYGN